MEKAGRRIAVGDRLPRGQIRVSPVAERATRRISGKLFPPRTHTLSLPLSLLPFVSLLYFACYLLGYSSSKSQKRLSVPWSNRQLKFRVLAREGLSLPRTHDRSPVMLPFSSHSSSGLSLLGATISNRRAALQAAPKVHIHANFLSFFPNLLRVIHRRKNVH